MSALLRPKVLVPALLSVAILGALLSFADVRKALSLVGRFRGSYLALIVLALVAYEAVRLLQWHLLLRHLGLVVEMRSESFAFLAGEVGKSLPIGNYLRDYLLQRVRGTDMSVTSAASTFIILVEVVVSVIGVLILDVPGWWWLRPAILGGLVMLALVALAVRQVWQAAATPSWLAQRRLWQRLREEVAQFAGSFEQLSHPRTIAVQVLLGALYLTCGSLVLYLSAWGLGVESLGLRGALVAYLFSLAVGLIFPLPVDLGVLEVSGVAALLALGIGRSEAITLMLVNRALSIGGTLVIGLATTMVLNREFRAALRERPRASAAPAGQGARRVRRATERQPRQAG